MTHTLAAALVLHLVNLSGAPPSIVRDAQQEVTHVYGRIGVHLEWDDTSESSADPSDIRVVLLPYETGDLRRSETQVMGAALRTPRGNSLAYVFYRRVEAQADHYRVSTGLVLACAIAHELGHLLLPHSTHAATGLMRARWTRDEFNRAEQGQLRFLPDDVARIRAGLP